MTMRVLTALALVGSLSLACGSEYAPYLPEESEPQALGTAEAAVAACEGDDLQYDFNAFAASLAVAIANELGRWDVLGDFELRNGKLELSQTGLLHCGTDGCNNITALLRLQDDAASEVPYHSPSLYRSKLATWYAAQKTKLVELATAAGQAEGTYRIVSRYSNKRFTVDGGSRNDNAKVELWDYTSSTGADQWSVQVSGTKHRLANLRSGKCLDLMTNSSQTGMNLVQRTCSGSDSQLFTFQDVDQGYVGVLNKYGKAAAVKDWQGSNDTPVVTENWNAYESNKAWRLEPVSGGAATPTTVANGMYALQVRQTSKMLGVEDVAPADGAPVAQRSYNAANDTFHWYVSKVADRFQLINRRSGMCLALLTDSASSEAVGQRACANVETQKFNFELIQTTGEKYYGIRGPYGKILMLDKFSQNEGMPLVLRSGNPGDEWIRQFRLDDILAGEPHRLTFSHTTDDGPCGDYYWYDIRQPNGLPLTSPEQSFVQLMFAGGKSALTAKDENPFIAQQVTGALVGIDPSGYLSGGSQSGSGSCLATDILFDQSRQAEGACCIRYNGIAGSFKQSSWNTQTFLCR
ncbi:MAG: RICIN domain-containing protein [Deltaproteobacteria bacterium]